MRPPPATRLAGLWALAGLVASVAGWGCVAIDLARPSPGPGPPNVVLVIADDLGWGDVSAFGGTIPTPAIDSLASEGARLTDFTVAAPVCTPSRFALLTGRYPERSGGGLDLVGMILDPAHAEHGLVEGERTLAEILRTVGYRTALVGKWHLGHGGPAHLPTRHGFDSFYGASGGCIDYFTHRYGYRPDWFRDEEPVEERGYATDLVTEEAVRFLGEARADEPFLLVLSYFAPHYGKSLAEDAGIRAGAATLATRPFGDGHVDPATGEEVRIVNSLQAQPEVLARFADVEDEKRRYYAAMVAALDEGVGRVLRALDERGLADTTLVLFTADNGADTSASSAGTSGPWRAGKATLYEGGVRVPTVLRWPGRVPAGVDLDQPSSALDLVPTLAALAGADVSSLTLDGLDLSGAWFAGEPVDRDLYWGTRGRAFRRGPWKLVGDELYRLDDDPGERNDLRERHPERRDELAAAHAFVRASLQRRSGGRR